MDHLKSIGQSMANRCHVVMKRKNWLATFSYIVPKVGLYCILFLLFWNVLGFGLLDEGIVIKLAYVLCGQEEDKGLVSCSFGSSLGNFERKK